MSALRTPDGRYIVVRGRLWRAANPNLSEVERDHLVKQLMDARRQVRSTDPALKAAARRDVDAAKHALGERGAVWWTDGAPDQNRRMVTNTEYFDWFVSVAADADPVFSQGTAGLKSRSHPKSEN